MAEKKQIYKCLVCGQTIEVLAGGAGQLVCCGQPMKHMEANTEDASQEKHVPAAVREDGLLRVKVGSAPHPMMQEHYIEWIEVFCDKGCFRKRLHPGDVPEAVFPVPCAATGLTVRIWCNLHGLWQAEVR